MAIQNRRGQYTNFNPANLVPGEFAVVQSGDPSGTDGYAVYMCFTSGVSKRIILNEDLTAALTDVVGDVSAIVGNLGDTYSASSTYAVGDYCVYDNLLYRCISTISTAEAFNSAHWTQVNVGDELIANIRRVRWSYIQQAPYIDRSTGTYSVIENDLTNNTAAGTNAHAEGQRTSASGLASHAEGMNTVASSQAAHAEGYSCHSTATAAHSEGNATTASGVDSHAENYQTIASGSYSHAEGFYSRATRRSQHVFGEYNVADTNGSVASSKGMYIEIVGNGTSAAARSNARTLDWSGNEAIAGNMTVGGGTLTLGATALTAQQLASLIAGAYTFTDPNNDGNIVITTTS